MITKNDLKAIGAVIQTQIDKSLVRGLTPIKEDIAGLKKDTAGLKEDTSGLKKDSAGLKKDMKIVKRTLNGAVKDIRYMSGKFDEEIVHTRRRVEKIEENLDITPHKN